MALSGATAASTTGSGSHSARSIGSTDSGRPLRHSCLHRHGGRCIARTLTLWPEGIKIFDAVGSAIRSHGASRRGTDRADCRAVYLAHCNNVFGLGNLFVASHRRLDKSIRRYPSTTGALSSRNRLGNFSRSRSASCAAGVARAGATGDGSASAAGPTAAFGRNRNGRIGGQFSREAPSVIDVSDRTRADDRSRDAIAFSIFLSCCSTNASPTKIRPPTTATAPGVITARIEGVVLDRNARADESNARRYNGRPRRSTMTNTYECTPDRTHGAPNSVTILAAR